MCRERIIRIVAGSFILISLVLAILFSKWWLLLTAFVGGNLLQSGCTDFCLLDIILKKFGVKSGTEVEQEGGSDNKSCCSK